MKILFILWAGIYICFGLLSYYLSLTMLKEKVMSTKDPGLIFLFYHGRVFIVLFTVVALSLIILGLVNVFN